MHGRMEVWAPLKRLPFASLHTERRAVKLLAPKAARVTGDAKPSEDQNIWLSTLTTWPLPRPACCFVLVFRVRRLRTVEGGRVARAGVDQS